MTKYQTCETCDAMGKVKCPHCDGSGQEPAFCDTCERCWGRKSITCPDCKGAGEVIDENEFADD